MFAKRSNTHAMHSHLAMLKQAQSCTHQKYKEFLKCPVKEAEKVFYGCIKPSGKWRVILKNTNTCSLKHNGFEEGTSCIQFTLLLNGDVIECTSVQWFQNSGSVQPSSSF